MPAILTERIDQTGRPTIRHSPRQALGEPLPIWCRRSSPASRASNACYLHLSRPVARRTRPPLINYGHDTAELTTGQGHLSRLLHITLTYKLPIPPGMVWVRWLVDPRAGTCWSVDRLTVRSAEVRCQRTMSGPLLPPAVRHFSSANHLPRRLRKCR